MPLRGELNSVDLAHVFQMLILNQKAGTLEIVSEGVKRPLFFTADGISIPYDEGLLTSRASRALVRKGLIDEGQLERARCNMDVLGKDLLGTLVEMKILEPGDRLQALRAELEEEVYELFFLRDASFEFRDGDLPEGVACGSGELALSPNGLIMEAARRIDEWEYIRKLVASGGDIVELRSELARLEARENDLDAALIFESIDGIRTVDEIIELTELPRFVVFRKLALFLDARIAGAVALEDLIDRARAAMTSGQVQSAVNLFERAIFLGDSRVDVLAGAGQAHETLGQITQAAGRYLSAGRRAEETGDLDAALKLYIRIRRLLPTQVEARERLFALRKLAETHLERDCYDAELEGFDLARILYALGRSEELALVLGGLLDLAGDRAEVVEQVSDLSAQLGQVAYAIDALLRASLLRGQLKDFRGAIACLKKAQSLDPSRADLADRIRSLADSARVRRQRRRSVFRALAMSVGFLLLFLGYGQYSRAAMESYSEYSLEDFLVTHEFGQGREHYRSIQWGYPLTIPFLLSFEMLRELEVAERHFSEIEQYRSRVEQDQAEGNLRQARVFFEAALNARHTGNLIEAVDLLRKVRRLSGDDDPLDAAAAIADLEEYLATARRIKSEAVFFRNAGRFEQAHTLLTELLAGYANSPEARDVGLPVRVTSEPSKARILLDGKPVRIGTEKFHVEAETPFVLDLPHDAEVQLTLILPGHVPGQVRVHGSEQQTIHLQLARSVDQVTILPFEVVQPLVSDGARIFAPLASGRVAALDAETLEVEWIRELPELADAVGQPTALEGVLLVPVSLNKLVLLRPEDGELLGELGVPGRPASAVACSGDRVAVRTVGGAVAVGPLGGNSLESAAIPSVVTAGPVALDGGRFAVGCQDGKVWICQGDGSVTSLFNPSAVTGSATALGLLGDTILMGDQSGSLHALQVGRPGAVITISVFPGSPLQTICTNGQEIFAGDGQGLARVDLARRKVSALLLDPGLSLSACSESHVVSSKADGTIMAHSVGRLENGARFAAEGGIRLNGLLLGERAVFPAAGGKVVSIFLPRQ